MEMIWYKKLYTGKCIRRGAVRVRRRITGGGCPRGVFLITLPPGDRGVLEIIEASQLKIPYVREHLPMIVGLALGKTEAECVVCRIVGDAVRATGNADARRFLQDRA